jgi:hypothetical protein
MNNITPLTLTSYQENTFCFSPERRLKHIDQAIQFVNERGFIFFWPNKDCPYPSLWGAVAGNRPVPNEHDDPGHISWDWKDSSLGKKVWYYGRCLHRRNAMLSLNLLPHFYALSPNYGAPEDDYIDQYQQGLLTPAAKAIYEILLREGPMDTLTLRRAASFWVGKESAFVRALDDLQMELKILPTGISPVGSWKYAFVYDLVHRHYPEIISQASQISENQAREDILHHFFLAVGAATAKEAARLFNNWPLNKINQTLAALQTNGIIIEKATIEGKPGEYYALPVLFNQ